MSTLSFPPTEEYLDQDEDDDVTEDDESEGGDESTNPASEETTWKLLPLEKKFQDVVESLAHDHQWSIDDRKTAGRQGVKEWKQEHLLKDYSKEDKSTPTFFHLLAKSKEEFCRLRKTDRKAMVQDALHRYHHVERLPRGDPVLNVAVLYDNDDFIDCLIECLGRDIGSFISQSDQLGQNCLHKIFRHPSTKDLRTKCEREKRLEDMKRQALERGRKMVDMAPPEAIMTKDSNGNTPLHCAMRYLLSAFREDDYVTLVKAMLDKEDSNMPGTAPRLNNKSESPILYYERTKAEAELREEQRVARRKKTEADREAKTQATPAAVDSQGSQSQKPTSQPNSSTRSSSNAHQGRFGPKGHMTDKRRPDMLETQLAMEPPQLFDKAIQRSYTMDRNARDGADAGHYANLGTPVSISGLAHESYTVARHETRQSKTTTRTGESGNARRSDDPESQRPKPVEPPKPRNDSEKALLALFTRHYLRTRTDLEARSLIYGRNKSVINLSLDASGHEKAVDIVQLITRMSHGGFSDTLAYLSIPTVANEEPKRKSRLAVEGTRPNQGVSMQKKEQNPDPGRTALTEVFDKLFEQKVRSILNLEVEDRRPPSHTDAAIEAALRGRDSFGLNGAASRPIAVETWDWRKPDLNIDVVIFAAPDVVTLNLYWSGNEAVLKGWSCPDGIPKLRKLKNLKLIAAPGLGTRARMDKVLDKFESDIRGARNGVMKNLKIEREVRMLGLMRDLDLPKHGSSWISAHVQGERQHAWIQQMEGFRSALRTIHDELAKAKAPEPQRVKVALLDDGVDLNQLTPYHGKTRDGTDKDIVKALGMSCCDLGQNLTNWAISSRGHGTIMANMILRINPWVELYSMKIQDGEDALGRRTIFPGSAANAIQGAIDLEANIISMSWSIRNKSQPPVPVSVARTISDSVVGELSTGMATLKIGGQRAMMKEESPMKALETAVDHATTQGMHMFCSATDDIQNGAMDFLPYQRGLNHIFRIGAATAQGERDPQAEDEKNTDYFFPGNQVADAVNPRSERQVKYHDGSSVSTALATGLASLIMYLARVMCAYYAHREDKAEVHRFEEWADKLQLRNNMRQAFDNINHVDWPNKKFLPVWTVFEERSKEIIKCRSLDDKMNVLDDLVRDLCNKVR